MKIFARILAHLGPALLFAACSGGGYSPAPSPPPPNLPPPASNVSRGGIWAGVDTDRVDVIALVTETGRFRWVNEFFDQGFGNLNVDSDGEIASTFQMVTQLGSTFIDGTTLANCKITGTLIVRQTMAVTVNCTTTAGLQSQSTITLNYNSIYERDSDLSVIAGIYDDAGLVLDVDANGVIFEQDPTTGCVTNGQVSVLDPEFNAYDVQFQFENCSGQSSVLNGASFAGMATLDNSVSPEALIVGATGEVSGSLVALFGISERL